MDQTPKGGTRSTVTSRKPLTHQYYQVLKKGRTGGQKGASRDAPFSLVFAAILARLLVLAFHRRGPVLSVRRHVHLERVEPRLAQIEDRAAMAHLVLAGQGEY